MGKAIDKLIEDIVFDEDLADALANYRLADHVQPLPAENIRQDQVNTSAEFTRKRYYVIWLFRTSDSFFL
ncbi:MAG: hypothetical protein WBN06_15765 [Lysobacterales bacterium]|jgi:hypothetical protein